MAKKNNKAKKKQRILALIEEEKREEIEREERRQKRAKRKERQETDMVVDLPDEDAMPAKRRKLLPKEMKMAASANVEEENNFVAVRASEMMDGVVATEEAKPNNIILTLGFDELKSAKSGSANKARIAAKIKSNQRLKRVRSKSKIIADAESSAMQM